VGISNGLHIPIWEGEVMRYECFECGWTDLLDEYPHECPECGEWHYLLYYNAATSTYKYVYDRDGEPLIHE
jgi:predicted RNA-binding Zn-ribbon protein involved in translation (DUF1610 family)